ncbi:hypothetical protein FKW77_002869 [Venturia effusa]|uniref:Uncharacterized protein n=1 Tax=Venturia effusa TaxID=50376 RepID=A0A517KZ92_9PEZI|nr:hypothetical protein FKW77_002869 [Venturia effusa]
MVFLESIQNLLGFSAQQSAESNESGPRLQGSETTVQMAQPIEAMLAKEAAKMKRPLILGATAIGIVWTGIAICYGMEKYFYHKRTQQHENFLLEAAVTSAFYSYALAWSQTGPTLSSALLAVPPGVTFGIWTISKKIQVQNRRNAAQV